MAYKPTNDLTVRAIIKLERVVNIPLLTELQPKLSELKKKAKFRYLDKQQLGSYYRFEPSLTAKYINSWVQDKLSTECTCVQPTWENFFTLLKKISSELGKLADQTEAYMISQEKRGNVHSSYSYLICMPLTLEQSTIKLVYLNTRLYAVSAWTSLVLF